MQPCIQALLMAAMLSTQSLGMPTSPGMAFADVERRWASGDSEAQIHAGQTHRDMTPAWPVMRRGSALDVEDCSGASHRRRKGAHAFASALDARSRAQAARMNSSQREHRRYRRHFTDLLAEMKAFVEGVLRAHGDAATAKQVQPVGLVGGGDLGGVDVGEEAA